jgi:hypothetical protein
MNDFAAENKTLSSCIAPFDFVLSNLILFHSLFKQNSKSLFHFHLMIKNVGRPRPNVTWYLENTVIDESFETRKDGITVNHLSYPNIGRQHLNARLVCVASNTNLTPPNNKAVILDVNCKLSFDSHILLKLNFFCSQSEWNCQEMCDFQKINEDNENQI